MPVQLATEELILFHTDDAELQRFLAASQGTVLDTQDIDGERPHATLVKVDPTKLAPARLALMRGLLEDRSELVTSKGDVAGSYGSLPSAVRLDGVHRRDERAVVHRAPMVNGRSCRRRRPCW